MPHPHLLKCLRERPLELLLSASVEAPEFATAFGPSIDGVVIDSGNPEQRNSNSQGMHTKSRHHIFDKYPNYYLI